MPRDRRVGRGDLLNCASDHRGWPRWSLLRSVLELVAHRPQQVRIRVEVRGVRDRDATSVVLRHGMGTGPGRMSGREVIDRTERHKVTVSPSPLSATASRRAGSVGTAGERSVCRDGHFDDRPDQPRTGVTVDGGSAEALYGEGAGDELEFLRGAQFIVTAASGGGLPSLPEGLAHGGRPVTACVADQRLSISPSTPQGRKRNISRRAPAEPHRPLPIGQFDEGHGSGRLAKGCLELSDLTGPTAPRSDLSNRRGHPQSRRRHRLRPASAVVRPPGWVRG